MMKQWIGVDLDGTLAEYHGWINAMHIGKPIPKMVARVKRMLADGKTVKIFTARVTLDAGKEEITANIRRWCKEHIGAELEVTNVKDFGMIDLYCDRCKQVVKNKGTIVGEQSKRYYIPPPGIQGNKYPN
jgi:hypothetical protein